MTSPDLRRRSRRPKLMDAEPGGFEDMRRCLRDLERINRWPLSYRLTLGWLDRLVSARRPPRPLVILDVGSGHGDMLRRIWNWTRAKDVEVELIGVDLNPQAALAAEQATPRPAPISYLASDVFDLPRARPVDAIVSALFAHHLDDASLVRFLRWMEDRARLGWLINDLHRHRLAYEVARLAPRLLRMSPLVRHDASVSVARAFDRADWQRLLQEAGLGPPATTVDWHFPFRYAVGRIKRPCPPTSTR